MQKMDNWLINLSVSHLWKRNVVRATVSHLQCIKPLEITINNGLLARSLL